MTRIVAQQARAACRGKTLSPASGYK